MKEQINISNPFVIFLTLILGLVFIASSCQQADREAAAAQHEELATSYVETLNTQNRAALEEILTDPFTYGVQEMTREVFLDHIEGVWEIFPNMQFDPTYVLTAEDYVTVRGVLTGTGDGEYHGHDIDGQNFKVTEIILLGVEEGQIARMYVERDDLDLWEQIANVEISPLSSNQDEETLRRLEHNVFDAWETPGDAEAIDRLYSEDFLSINADASYSDKQEAMEIVEAGQRPVVEKILNDETRVRQFGDTAVITGRSRWVGPEGLRLPI